MVWCQLLSCCRDCDAKQAAYCAWSRARSADNLGHFVLARAEAQRVYGATRESHNERTMNSLKHSTCSHNARAILGKQSCVITPRFAYHD